MPGKPTRSELLDYADQMAATGRPSLARLCAEEAAQQTTDPHEAARILADYPDPNAGRKE
ncbi:hypothetical protein [Streptomyces radiopugnans]|uniref:hypothetical protein n=1 Tax=Streptomyces radiopugnans TaxID=403935 RepID=UPI003F1BDACF